jgi:hypothetical protein
MAKLWVKNSSSPGLSPGRNPPKTNGVSGESASNMLTARNNTPAIQTAM